MKAPAGTTPQSGAPSLVPPLADAAPVATDASIEHGTPAKTGTRARPTPGPERGPAEQGGSSNLDQLRDIIFGGQMRDYEKRFVRMEERITKELADAREEVRQRCTTLERYVREELERIDTASDVAGKQQRELRMQLLEQTRTITDDVQRRHTEIVAMMEREATELREDKADRHSLSALFMELALRLRGESVIPAQE